MLEQAKDLPSDLHLVRLVQLQITAETVIAAISEDDGGNNLNFSAYAMFDLLGREVKKADPSGLLPSDGSSSSKPQSHLPRAQWATSTRANAKPLDLLVLLSLSYHMLRLLLYRTYLDEVSH